MASLNWDSEQLSKALGFRTPPNINIPGKITQDSRLVEAGDLFICLKLPGIDGHKCADHALDMGARAIIAQDTTHIKKSTKANTILVDNTYAAMWQLARFKRLHSDAIFIAVTGSAGKTTTKDAIKTVLSGFGQTYGTEKNMNNQIGLPLCLANMRGNPRFAVFETALSRPGDITEITKLLRPDIGVITCMTTAHLAFFYDMDDLVDGKCELLASLPRKGKILFYNDHDYVDRIRENIAKFPNLISYPYASDIPGANGYLQEYQHLGRGQVNLLYNIEGTKISARLHDISEHHAKNCIPALLLANMFGLDLKKAAAQLANLKIMHGRGNIVTYKRGSTQIKCICDHYNANPASVKASLEYLSKMEGRKLIMLGDMTGLGIQKDELHIQLIPHIRNLDATKIVLVGDSFKLVYEKMKNLDINSQLMHFDSADSLMENIEDILSGIDAMLVKASKMRLQKAVDFMDTQFTH